GPVGKTGKATTAVTAKTDGGLARVVLVWNPHRPDLTADVRADVTVQDRQVVVNEVIKLRSPDGFLRGVRFRGPGAAGLKSQPALDAIGPGEWALLPMPDTKELTVSLNYAVHIGHSADDHAAWKVPAGLVWPVGASRAEATVRAWSNTVIPRTLTNLSPGWRELPVEPVPERGALPALVLAATGSEAPLALEAREVTAGAAVAVWVDRALIQASATDNRTTSYRARFLLRRWLAPAIEVRLPVPLTGPNP